jgi:hypothetical protein
VRSRSTRLEGERRGTSARCKAWRAREDRAVEHPAERPRQGKRTGTEAWKPTKHAVGKHGKFDRRVPLRFARPRRLSSVAVLTVGALKLDSNELPLFTGR